MLWGFFWRRSAFISLTCLCPLLGRNHFMYTFALSFSHHEMVSSHTANLHESSFICKISGETFSFSFCNFPWTVEVAGDGFIYHLSLYAILKFIYLVVLYLSRKSTIKSPLLGGLLAFLTFFLCLLWFSKKQDHNVFKFNMLVKCFEINNQLISLASFLYFICIYISHIPVCHIYIYIIFNITFITKFHFNCFYPKILVVFSVNISQLGNSSFISLIYFKSLLSSVNFGPHHSSSERLKYNSFFMLMTERSFSNSFWLFFSVLTYLSHNMSVNLA